MTSDKITIDKSKLYKNLDKIIACMSSTCIGVIWGIFLLMSVMFDCCSKDYWNRSIEKIFSYNMGTMVSIVVVIWTFTVTVCMFCLSQRELQFYGIRIADAVFRKFSMSRIIKLVVVIAFEMIVLIIVTILEWEITLVVVAFFQFYITCLTFAMVFAFFSRSFVVDIARKECENICNEAFRSHQVEQNMSVFLSMVQNTDYGKAFERGIISKILIDYFSSQSRNNYNDLKKDNLEDIRKCCAAITVSILSSRTKEYTDMCKMIEDWFECNDRGDDDFTLAVKKGIIQGMIDGKCKNRNKSINFCYELIEHSLTSRDSLGIWMLIYCYSISQSIAQDNAKKLCKNIAKRFFRFIMDKDAPKYVKTYCDLLNVDEHELLDFIDYS